MPESPENANMVAFSPIMPNLHSDGQSFLTRYAPAGNLDGPLALPVCCELSEMDRQAFRMGLPLVEIPGVAVPT
jgi:hypothetical protein